MFWRRLLSCLTLAWMALHGLSAGAATVTRTPTSSTADCTSVSGIGTRNWSNPNRAYRTDNSLATAAVDGTTTVYLRCLNYGFSIPSTSTILGVRVNVNRKSNRTSNGGANDAAVRLVTPAGGIGATDRSTATLYTTSLVNEAHGTATDLWGLTTATLTPDVVNAAGFGAAFAATKASSSGSSHTMAVDQISITVDYTDDTTPPVVSSITRGSLATTSASSVSWTVTFSEAVTGVNTSDFSLAVGSGLGGTSITSVAAISTTQYTVTASAGSGSGTLGLNLVDDDSVRDVSLNTNRLGGNGNGNGNFTGEVYTVDRVSPVVGSINRVAASPTNAASVSWTVVFNRSVSGVNAADFALAQGGAVSGAALGAVAGSGTTYTVAASTGSGSGTLGLNLVDDDSIADSSTGIALGGTGAANGNATGQVYSVDKTAPTVTSINRTDPDPTTSSFVSWTVTFSEAVANVDAADFQLAATGLAGAVIGSVTGSGATWAVKANTGYGSGTLGLNLVDNDSILDAPGNALGGSGTGNGNFTGQVYTVPSTPPLAAWSMDETWNGTTDEVADSQGSFPGTAQNGAITTTSGSRSCRFGVFDNGSTITSGHILLPGFPDLSSDFTVTAWIRTTNNAIAGQRVFVDDATSGGYGISLGDAGTGALRFFARGSSTVILDTPNVIANNTWYFVAGVADITNGTRRLYVFSASGALLSAVSTASTGWTTTDPGDASIGGEVNASAESPASFHLRGNIDDVKVFDKVLAQSALAALLAQSNTCFNAAAVDHYELSLPTGSLSCSASTVTVTACADATSPCTNRATTLNGQTATLGTTGATLAATTVTFDATGQASTSLSYPAAANGTAVSVALSGEQTTATNARKCCPDGVSCAAANSCSTTFNSAGFIFAASANGASATLPTQTAGSASSTYYLRAVKTSTTTQVCVAALTGSTTVNWAAQCNNPTTCAVANAMTLTGSSAAAVAGNPNSGVTATTAVPMTFDANGNAPFSFNHADVGLVTLSASKASGGSLLSSLSGSTNAFVVKPAGFIVSGIKCTSYAAGACATSAIASPGNNPGAASAAGTAFIPAGQAFSATVTAVNSAGSTTPNYGRETTPQSVNLSHTLVQPAGGSAGLLGNASSFGAFSGGAATGTAFNWSEVGIITLRASVADANYLGVGDVTGTSSGNVGRFMADHFDTVVTQGCTAGSFSYSGQPFSVRVTAMNGLSASTVTTNYGGTTFAKAVTLTDGASLAGGSLTGGAIAATAFASGVANSATPVFTFTSAATAPGSVKVRAADTDGVSSLRAVAASSLEGSTTVRSGRIRLQNAYGSERLALRMPLDIQYWNNGWQANTADNCTSIGASQFSWVFPTGSAARPNNLAACESALTVAGTAPAFTVTLSAPGVGNTGWADLALNLGVSATGNACTAVNAGSGFSGAASTTATPWLQHNWSGTVGNPAARASFGVFKSPIIYGRENY